MTIPTRAKGCCAIVMLLQKKEAELYLLLRQGKIGEIETDVQSLRLRDQVPHELDRFAGLKEYSPVASLIRTK